MYKATFTDVDREVFTDLSERLKKEVNYDVWTHVTLHYIGSNIRGDLTIDGRAGYGDSYKKALKMFNEEYCK